ncbi:MAG TPA: hypothetical protein VMF53_13170 [Alphaproteobacteria bacterium]|nr:hypothetical protein [Alphaproteobacteria bacterium]
MSTADRAEIDAPAAPPDLFARQGYLVVPKLIEPALVDFLWAYVHTKFASLLMPSGERQVPNTPAGYGDAAFDGLLEYLRPRVAAAAGCRLYPTYSYFRLYKRGDVLRRHRDRPACEISLSLNIGQVPADPWPLHIEGKTGPAAARLAPGDGLLYRGCDCAHWRERFEGERCAQAFLHYVDADGPNRDERFDRRKTLMSPAVEGRAHRNHAGNAQRREE